jgi:hypothetical protein
MSDRKACVQWILYRCQSELKEVKEELDKEVVSDQSELTKILDTTFIGILTIGRKPREKRFRHGVISKPQFLCHYYCAERCE